MTADGTILGTPYYMSPEQARGQLSQIDHRADIYALGGILYFLLTQQHPGEVNNGNQIDTRQTTQRLIDGSTGTHGLERPRKIDAKIPRALEAICLKSMSLNQDDRYSDADLLGSDILSFLDGQPVSAYPENVFEKANRWVGNNRFVLYLILTYIVMRFLIFLLLRR
jgi:serine/threonine protein kinase